VRVEPTCVCEVQSPRGHALGLEAPRGQYGMSLASALALALRLKSLALTLALKTKSLALASDYVFLTPTLVNYEV